MPPYYQNCWSLVATIREVLPNFGRNCIPNSSIVEKVFEKFERGGSVVYAQHTKRAHSGLSETNIAVVRGRVGETLKTRKGLRAQELDLPVATLYSVLTKKLNFHA